MITFQNLLENDIPPGMDMLANMADHIKNNGGNIDSLKTFDNNKTTQEDIFKGTEPKPIMVASVGKK